MEKAFVKMKNGKPRVKFPEDKNFGPLTTQFDYKPLEKVVEMLKQLPANEGIEFEIIGIK